MKDISNKPVSSEDIEVDSSKEKTTPLRCFISSVISAIFAFGLYSLFSSIVATYATKRIVSDNAITVNLASAVRTLVMGTVALGTGVFAMVSIGLLLLGIQLTVQNLKKA